MQTLLAVLHWSVEGRKGNQHHQERGPQLLCFREAPNKGPQWSPLVTTGVNGKRPEKRAYTLTGTMRKEPCLFKPLSPGKELFPAAETACAHIADSRFTYEE